MRYRDREAVTLALGGDFQITLTLPVFDRVGGSLRHRDLEVEGPCPVQRRIRCHVVYELPDERKLSEIGRESPRMPKR